MNFEAVKAIYVYEMTRFFRTLTQSFISPVISTSLYFVVFGAAIGSRIQEVEGISYGAFIVPGLIMLSVITQARALLLESTFLSLLERFSSCFQRRSIFWKSSWAMSERLRPKHCSSG